MNISLLHRWNHLIRATNELEIDGPPLEVVLNDPNDLRQALMALVLYSSRLEARGYDWGLAIDSRDTTLFVYKLSKDAPAES